MKKYSLLLLSVLLYASAFAQLKQYPMVLGYTAGQNVTAVEDTLVVSFNGGSGMIGKGVWSNTDYGRVLPGFMYNAVIVPETFLEDLSVSKGYFDNFVDIKWTLAANEDVVTRFKIYRKELGSAKDSIEVANLSKDERTWRDEYCETGVMYQYFLYAEGIFGQAIKWKNYIDGIGFRIPYGVISGRVTFASGNAVEGVEVMAEADQDFAGSSIYLNGTNAFLGLSPAEGGDPQFNFAPDFTFQAWIKPQGTGTQTIFEKGSQYKLIYQPNSLTFTAAGQSLMLNFTAKTDTFFSVTAMRTADSLKVFVVYDEKTTYKTSVKLTANPIANSQDIYLGKSTAGEFFKGYLDEVRIWHKSFTDYQVYRDVRMYISGKETGLTAYYRMNENVGDYFYDLAREGFDFHENHGALYNAQWAKSVPFSKQLAVKGITDENGNYVIAGIPYASTGTNYRFVPVYDVHNFDPNEKTLYLGPGASTHSGVNFTDIAAFIVKGNVRYKDTYFPVKGARLYIDDRLVVTPSGFPVETDDFGNYEISVPIGYHYIHVKMFGHGYANEGRFPTEPDSKWNFQEAISGIDFLDTTLVKVVGRVAGGPREAEKQIGLGKTNNNLGNAKITMTTQREYDLTSIPDGIDAVWKNEMWEADVLKSKGQTRNIIKKLSPKSIEIYPDPETGEYFAYLLPEKYLITGVEAGDYVYPESFRTTLDLTMKSFITQVIDSVKIGQSTNQLGDTIYFYRIDSLSYNHQQDFIYREVPSIDVTNKDGDAIFWEKEMKANNDSLVSLVNADGSLRTAYPVFVQHGKYKLKVSVFERYINKDKDNEEDLVPVNDGKVEIQNYLAKNISLETLELNKLGIAYYNFSGGLPNITTGGIGDYLQTMSVIAKTGKNGSIATPWQYKGDTFKGYVIGAMPTGNNFVTTGPNEIITILRDPPGSNSYAYLEEGSTMTTTHGYSANFSADVGVEINAKVGAKTNVFTWATIESVEVRADLKTGLNITNSYNFDGSRTSTVTNTQRWQTSESDQYVGSNGDVFIGNSTNIVYGASTNIDLIPINSPMGEGFTGTPFDQNGVVYDIGKTKGFRISPEFNTAFQYSQAHIEYYLIPNLKMLRNNYLQTHSNYTCVVCDPSDPKYAQNNTTGKQLLTGYTGGDSYNYTVPNDFDYSKGQYTDSVRFYNQQVKEWEYYLRQNEKSKLNAELEKNISFDAGTTYESSQVQEKTVTEKHAYELQIGMHTSALMGFAYNDNTGVFVEVAVDVNTGAGYSNEQIESTTTNYGYVLSDGNSSDYLSVDVKTPDKYSTVFATRGGQTMCPYEKATLTKYYQKGSVLSEATMQREVPNIVCETPLQRNVPEDEPAVFNLLLSNLSETDELQYMVLGVNQVSNQNGAIIKVDGEAIGNGKMIAMPAKQTIQKVLTIEKGPGAVYEYNDIAITFLSACQADATSANGVIGDTVLLYATFQPVCTDVTLESPEDQWVINTNGDTTLNVKMVGYDLQHSSFNKIALQYKSTSTSNWATEMVYYVDKDEYDAAQEPKTYINGQAELEYKFDWSSMQDRNYNLKATSYCVDGTQNNSPILTGIKDVKRPQVFGSPQPADGILNAGDDVMITFDENINAGLLLPYNFSVQGVLNGNEIKHQSALYFDGQSDYATAIKGVDLDNKSWTVEFWLKRGALQEGVIFSQGNVEVGFNTNNQFYLTVGSQTITAQQIIADTEIWKHYAVTYKAENKTFAIYINDQIERELVDQTSTISGNGKMYVGKSPVTNKFFNGFVHELRVWEKALGFGTIYAQMYRTLGGYEIGLGGYWTMDELRGDMALDKSRSRHLLLFGAEWRAFPNGYARVFDANNSYVNITTGASVVIYPEADFTLEFYFKAKSGQANTVMFSNGRGVGTDIAPAFQNIWVVGFDANGQLYARNNGADIIVRGTDLRDDQWHHFALVKNEISNGSIYVDGELKAYEQSSLLGGLGGANMTIGARMEWHSDANLYDRFFEGSIDEFRIWNLARTQKQMALDMNSKLRGTEMGLAAYYPFDKYNDLGILLIESLDDASGKESTDAVAVGGSTSNTDIPQIKDARPVQDVAFTWVVNEDQVVININEQPSLIEKCVLEFTMDRVEDMRENRIASPATWTAYISQNSVLWDSQDITIKKEVFTDYSFDVEIVNVGGTEQSYRISGLPSWLKVSEIDGTLAPDSRKKVRFSIDPVVNVGYYNFSLYLESDFGYPEKLNIDLTVFKPAPVWTVNEGNFQYSMNVIGQLKINGAISDDPNDIVAAFVNGECRGVANVEYVKAYDNFEVYLNIYSNLPSGEAVELKVWDASAGQIMTQVLPAITFAANDLMGTPSQPIAIVANQMIEAHLPLKSGWNWVSFNLQSDALKNTADLFKNTHLADKDLIKSATAFDIYSDVSKSWFGTLATSEGIKHGKNYMVKNQNSGELVYVGTPVDPNFLINLEQGWNWIGYIPLTNMRLNEALSGFNPTQNDVVKSQTAFAYYDNKLGWVGSLTFMQSGVGYLYKSGAKTSFSYPERSSVFKNDVQNLVTDVPQWSINRNQYGENMSVIATATGIESDIKNIVVGAFVGNECRGLIQPVEINGTPHYFLTVYGEHDDMMYFKAIDTKTGQEYIANESEQYRANKLTGTVQTPKVLTFKTLQSTNSLTVLQTMATPNPFADYVQIISNQNIDKLEIYNTLGMKVFADLNTQGTSYMWNGKDTHGQGVVAGTYFVKVYSGTGIQNLVVVKM